VTLPCLRDTDAGVELFLYIQPRASRNKVAGIQGEELKVALTAPPVDGAANQACRMFIAKLCKIPRSRVLLIAGETSRHKRLLLEGAGIKQINALLEDLLGG
jgi:uncharacterized protein